MAFKPGLAHASCVFSPLLASVKSVKIITAFLVHLLHYEHRCITVSQKSAG